MKPRYGTPRELVEGLAAAGRRRTRPALGRGARAGGPPDGELIARHHFDHDGDRLTLHALHHGRDLAAHPAAARLRPPLVGRLPQRRASFRSPARPCRRSAAGPAGRASGRPRCPPVPCIKMRPFLLPYERVGGFWYGGDWYGGRTAVDGALWVIVADITGHGYHAYLLASVLPNIWDACWRKAPAGRAAGRATAGDARNAGNLPAGRRLRGMHAGAAGPDGEATVAPAGGSRLLLRRKGGPSDLLKLRGGWLGLLPPSSADQQFMDAGRRRRVAPRHRRRLRPPGRAERRPSADRLGRPPPPACWRTCRDCCGKPLQLGPQKDDITLVLLRRRTAAERPPLIPSSPLRKGADDVPM